MSGTVSPTLLLLVLLLAAERRQGRLSRLASRATGAVAEVVDPDAIVDRVDVDAVVRRIDVDALVDRIDVDALISRIDIDSLLAGVDLDAVIKQIDLDAALGGVDVDGLLDRVDVDRLLDRVDVDRLLDRVDVDRLLDRVEVDRLLDRADVNRLLDRVEVDAVVDRVDIRGVVDRAGIADIVKESTGQVAGSVLDVARRQLVAVDEIAGRAAFRLTGRDPRHRPVAPQMLVSEVAVDQTGRAQVTGHYAGPLSRLAAFAVDVVTVFWVFTAVAAGLTYLARLLFGLAVDASPGANLFGGLALVGWAFFYTWLGLALAGRTVGKGLVGLRVVERSGRPLSATRALGRTLAFPVSFLFFGLGFVGLLVGGERRGLHDAVGGSVVVYDWGERPAEMPAPLTRWLARHTHDG